MRLGTVATWESADWPGQLESDAFAMPECISRLTGLELGYRNRFNLDDPG